ncbi:plasmid replication protein, CyRepA1 family [Bradyrhizobium erythrophlei]|uniref:Origin of replication binding protein n=1 Tax=Bradyrhizobium erythrophlei TaxID=1437360 RepID=A0A1M5YPW7_9BRAD|nr:plasmid replication protein, CyRepA1 family [Bradyrhizobium erythrophlei]SHI13573.1 hypothetical protein SAMN05443248_8561 [Bradyrhizobium erythrophlei]
MSSIPATYPVSINANIIGKPTAPGPVNYAKDWQPMDVIDEDFIGHISQGRAYSAQFVDGYRKTRNFIRCGFVAADFDGGPSLEEALDHAFIRQHASFVHTTASHTAVKHRYRVVFLLDEPVPNAQDFADAQLGIALTMGSDLSVTDGARMFYGSTSAIVHRIGRTLPPDVFAKLRARGRDAREARSPRNGGLLPVDSSRRLAGPELIKLASGVMVRMDEIRRGEKVHCPHHNDGDPSAFVVPSWSRRGGIGIHCSACKATFWLNDAVDDYDFAGFDRMCEEGRASPPVDPFAEGLDRFFPPEPTFEKCQERYLPRVFYKPGITLIKSPKGSGKTQVLVQLLDDIRAGRYMHGIKRKDRPRSILLVGHRQTLLREAAAKLGLHCYLDQPTESEGMRTLAVCLDSLPKYNEPYVARFDGRRPIYERAPPFDLVIIDEVEQVLSHLLSDTLQQRAGIERCFDALLYEVAGAKAVIGLDADLGLVTSHAMRTMRPEDWESRCRIICNAPVVPVVKRTLRLFKRKKALEHELIEAIKKGQRCFVTSNSKKLVDTLHRMILNECGEGVSVRKITRDNSRDAMQVQFVKDIKTEILTVQVLVCSPSLGTGIDITFADGECRIDRVFGFFYSFVNTHTDIDQQLSRVRNPASVDVWIDPGRFNFTSNVDVVMDDLARAYTVKRAVKGRREDGMVEYDRDDPLLLICAHVTAVHRASKNRLLELFCELREANGWSIERVDPNTGSGAYGEAKRMLAEERAQMLLAAETLPDPEFIELDARVTKGAAVTPHERIAHEKNHFERTVGAGLDLELIELNKDGRLIERIVALADVTAHWRRASDVIDHILREAAKPKARLSRMKPPRLIAVLMAAAGLADADGIKPDHIVTIGALSEFVELCRENRTMIEEALSEPSRGDLAENPVRQLNRFLQRIGLKVAPAGSVKVQGMKIRRYALDRKRLETMEMLAKSYRIEEDRREHEKVLVVG